MQPDELFHRYQELQRYVGWSDYDVMHVRSAGPLIEPFLPRIIDDFYDQVSQHHHTRVVITGGREQVRRLKQTLSAWIRELFASSYDRDYVLRRWRVGWRHVEIGLDRMYTAAAFSRMRDGLNSALQEGWQGDAQSLNATFRSLNKLLDLDLAIIEMAYQAEYGRRHERHELDSNN